ncbi:MAG: hypothetical protein H0T60_02345 [Acidobacteria bacterium]|nr:hypothetical protein [Acidobacteriota bacterium]
MSERDVEQLRAAAYGEVVRRQVRDGEELARTVEALFARLATLQSEVRRAYVRGYIVGYRTGQRRKKKGRGIDFNPGDANG